MNCVIVDLLSLYLLYVSFLYIQATPNTSNWSEEEKKAFEKYGRLPKTSQILGKKV